MEYSPLTEICYVIDNRWFRKEICHDTFFISGSLKIVLYILYILSSNYLVKPYTSTQLLDLCLLEACSFNTRSKGLRSETASCSAYIYTVFSTWCKSFSDTSPWTFLVPRLSLFGSHDLNFNLSDAVILWCSPPAYDIRRLGLCEEQNA